MSATQLSRHSMTLHDQSTVLARWLCRLTLASGSWFEIPAVLTNFLRPDPAQ
jgi:hypothetical protein